jgi:hypothetical protein
LEHDPGSVVISQTKTNSAGVAVFPNVKPGKYRMIINGIFDRWGGGPCPCAADIEIDVPGQAKVVRSVSKPDARSMKTADPLVVPFTVAGNEVRSVSVTIKEGSGSK